MNTSSNKFFIFSLTISLILNIFTYSAEALSARRSRRVVLFSSEIYDACRDTGGSIVWCLFLDPEPSSSVVEIGTEIKYDSSKVNILPESSGFLCEFSVDGSCPQAPLLEGFNEIVTLGSPRTDTTFSLSVNDDTIIFNHDLSENPTPALEKEFFFFAIAFEPIGNQEITSADFVQQINSPNQICRTIDERFSCGSVSVPETSSILGLLAFGGIGLLSSRKRVK